MGINVRVHKRTLTLDAHTNTYITHTPLTHAHTTLIVLSRFPSLILMFACQRVVLVCMYAQLALDNTFTRCLCYFGCFSYLYVHSLANQCFSNPGPHSTSTTTTTTYPPTTYNGSLSPRVSAHPGSHYHCSLHLHRRVSKSSMQKLVSVGGLKSRTQRSDRLLCVV